MKKIFSCSKWIELNLTISAAMFSSLFWMVYLIICANYGVLLRELLVVLSIGVLLISLPYVLVFFIVSIINRRWVSYLFLGLLVFIADSIIASHDERVFIVYIDILKYFGVYDQDLLFIYSEIPYRLLNFQYFYAILFFVANRFIMYVLGLKVLKLDNKCNYMIITGVFVFVIWSWVAFGSLGGMEIPMIFACIFSYPFAVLKMINSRRKYLLEINR